MQRSVYFVNGIADHGSHIDLPMSGFVVNTKRLQRSLCNSYRPVSGDRKSGIPADVLTPEVERSALGNRQS